MKFLPRLAALAIIAAVIAGCAGRQATPVAAVQPGDDALSREQIMATLKLNSITVKDLMGESSSTVGKNVAAGVVGAVMFSPALFFMDTKNAAGDEARALL